jgi:predicted DNA-binding ribbon-helix-helix protein
VPRGEKPRRGNNEDDHDDEDAAVLIASIPSLLFAFGNFNSFVRVLVYTLYDKKEEQERSVFLDQLCPSN